MSYRKLSSDFQFLLRQKSSLSLVKRAAQDTYLKSHRNKLEHLANMDVKLTKRTPGDSKDSVTANVITQDLSLSLPEKPEEPLPSDCCGTGCTPCVYDLYDEELKQWEEDCCRIRAGISQHSHTNSDHEPVLSTSAYRAFEIESITKQTWDSFIYRFKLKPHCSLGLNVGQHIILRWKADTKTVTRQYTPVSELTARGYFDVLIKLYKNGEMSRYVRTWVPGDNIEWRGPYGRFTYTPRQRRRILMLAAGTGLAPMAQVASHVLQDEEDETRLHLLYACKHYEDILLKSSLDTWADYWNFSVIYLLSEDTNKDTRSQHRYGDDVRYQRIDRDLLTSELGDNIQNTVVLICGTKSFDKDMVNYLKHIGVPESNYFRF